MVTRRGIFFTFFLLLSGLSLFCCIGGSGGSSGGDAGISWDAPARISTGDGNVHYPSVATEGSGNALTVWVEEDATGSSDIFSVRYDSSSGLWGSPRQLSASSPSGAWEPDLSVDAAGRATAAWYQMDAGGVNIYAIRHLPGTGWDNAALVIDALPGDAYFPQVAAHAAGDVLAVWQQDDGSRTNLFGARFALPGGWGTPGAIATDNAGQVELPSKPGAGRVIRVSANGDAHALWIQDGQLRGNRYDNASGSWGTAVRIDAGSGGSNRDGPTLAVDGAGVPVAVWLQFSPGGVDQRVMSSRFDLPGGGWGAPVVIDNSAGNAASPQVAGDGAGNLVAVWQRVAPGKSFELWASRYRPGSGWDAPERLDTNDATDAYYPQVVSDPGGTFYVLWEQSDGSRSRIWMSRRTSGSAGWDPPAALPADPVGDAREPRIATEGPGTLFVLWKQDDETGRYHLWAMRSR